MKKERLRTADSEGRDNNRAATFYGALDYLSQHLGRVGGIVGAVPIGGFHHDVVSLRERGRIGKHRIAVAPKVTRKRNAATVPFDVCASRTQNVTRIAERQGRTAWKLKGVLERHNGEHCHGAFRIAHAVKR